MRSKGFAVIVGGGQGKNKSFSVRPNRIADPKYIGDIEKRLLERFNGLADTCFCALPFDEDMWDYLHELREEILELGKRSVPEKAFMEWNDPVQVKTYYESIHERLEKCEKALGLKSNCQVYQAKLFDSEIMCL